MTVDKRINYEMQGGSKPARNYLGKQKTVSNVPIKWKSGPNAPSTELAYITEAEKNLLLEKDLHGSLKNGPNTGPDDIMSLDSQGDYTRDRSPGAYTGGGGSPNQQSQSSGTSQQALRNRAMNEKHMKEILTGQKDIGQTASVSDKVRRGAVPEYVYGPDGKPKYVGSAYKSTGQQGFLSKLFGGSGYRGTVGTGSGRIFDRKSSIKFNPATGRYESEEEDVGDIKPSVPFGIMGILQSLQNKFRKPKDMSQFNTLGAAQTGIAANVPMESIDRWTQPIDQNQNVDLASARVEAGNFINNINDQSNMASGMQMSNDQMTSMDNLINMYQNKNLNTVGGNNMWDMNADQANAMAASYGMGSRGANQNNLYNYRADGGRIGYAGGELVDEDINIEDPGFDVNENMEMAEGPSPFELRVQELVDTGMSWQQAYTIAEEEFGLMAEGQEDSFSEEGIASLV